MATKGWATAGPRSRLLKKVMFTDECPVPFQGLPNRQNTRIRTTSKSLVPVARRVHSNGGHVMVAAGITWFGATEIFIIPSGQTVNAAYYSDEMVPFYTSEGQRLFGAGFDRAMLQEDGAPGHKAKRARAAVSTTWPGGVLNPGNSGNFFWPGNSPDLNPIEPMWAALKEAIWAITPTTDRMTQVTRIKEAWKKICDSGLPRTLVKSFPVRIQAVQASGGSHTKY